MADYHTFTVVRTTEPDRASLLSQLRSLDATAGVQHDTGSSLFTVKKATAWTAQQIAAAQSLLETAPAASSQLTAQAVIDAWPIEVKALVLTLIDQINVLRAGLPSPLPAITPSQALQAIRNKAATL